MRAEAKPLLSPLSLFPSSLFLPFSSLVSSFSLHSFLSFLHSGPILFLFPVPFNLSFPFFILLSPRLLDTLALSDSLSCESTRARTHTCSHSYTHKLTLSRSFSQVVLVPSASHRLKLRKSSSTASARNRSWLLPTPTPTPSQLKKGKRKNRLDAF